ncbi:shikimate dehydrogenase [Minwuia sp.]|uniref:shikimate dehydrogenase n=1 Tax=Minwuia sp. TaxID=2493630 RepID=UPI003A94B99B
MPPGQGSILVGLIGEGIALSRTPAMHEAEAARQGQTLVYKLLDTARMTPRAPELADLLEYARHLGYAGLNITYPFKQAVVPLLDELSDIARTLGAVNTVVMKGGRLAGYNTDYWGFRESFQVGMRGELRENVLLIGAGGAGAAVAQALLDVGVQRLMLADTDAARARALADTLNARFPGRQVLDAADVEEAAACADGIVNATPVGMAKLPGTPIPVRWLKPAHWVVDIIYFPMETEFLRAARAMGCRASNGSGMAVLQAARAFEHFTGLSPDADAMRRTFECFGD